MIQLIVSKVVVICVVVINLFACIANPDDRDRWSTPRTKTRRIANHQRVLIGIPKPIPPAIQPKRIILAISSLIRLVVPKVVIET